MPSKLEISFYLDDVFVCAGVLFAYFQEFYLKFELLIKLRADFEYFQRVMPIIFMIQHLQYLDKMEITFPKAPDPNILRI